MKISTYVILLKYQNLGKHPEKLVGKLQNCMLILKKGKMTETNNLRFHVKQVKKKNNLDSIQVEEHSMIKNRHQ